MMSVDVLIFLAIAAGALMLFYKSPPRIIFVPEQGKWFVIRYDMSLFSYVALDRESNYWWLRMYLWNSYSGYNTEAEAIKRLKRFKEKV